MGKRTFAKNERFANIAIRIKQKRMKGKFLLFFLLFYILPASPGFCFEVIDEVVAAVNGAIITRTQLEEEINMFKAETGVTSINIPEKKKILWQIIEEYVLTQEAENKGFTVSNTEIKKVMDGLRGEMSEDDFVRNLEKNQISLEGLQNKIRRHLLQDKIIKWKANLLINQIRIDKSEINDFYLNLKRYLRGKKTNYDLVREFYAIYKDKLNEEEKIHLAQIIVKNEAQAKKIKEKLIQGEEFEDLARKFSKGARAKEGGDLGWINLFKLNETLRSALSGAEKGDIVGPIKIDEEFYQIIEVKDRVEISFQQWEKAMEDFLKGKKVVQLIENWINQLKSKSFIQIMDEKLKDE